MMNVQDTSRWRYFLFWYMAYAYYQNDHVANLVFSRLKDLGSWFEDLLYKKYWRDLEIVKPIFILGPHRSGTTILQQILCLHSAIATPRTYSDHFDLAPILSKKVSQLQKLQMSRVVDNVIVDYNSPQEAHGLFSRFFNRDQVLYNPISADKIYDFMRKLLYLEGKTRFLWKLPHLTIHVPEIVGLFPDCKFIYLHRDPVECVNSKIKFIKIWRDLAERAGFSYRHLVGKTRRFEQQTMGYFWECVSRAVNLDPVAPDPLAIAEDHLRWIEKALKDLNNLGSESRFCYLDYRTLIDEPQNSLGKIFQFLEIPDESESVISKLGEIGMPLMHPVREFKYIPQESIPEIVQLCKERVQKCLNTIDLSNWLVIGSFPK